METIDIGVIGGSGFYDMPGFKNKKEVFLDTPFGAPSDAYMVGELGGKRVAFLARHNRKHNLFPSEVNYRANIYGFKMLGAKYLISASAVGSMKEGFQPTHFVFPDQYIDRTRHRPDTFFGGGIVAHVSLADPVCGYLREVLFESSREAGVVGHLGGAYLCMEGPQFSTRAESFTYRSWDVDVIGMTNLPEAKLAREAEIAYATIAMVTDYDCWHEDEEHVTVEQVVKILHLNADHAANTISKAIERIDMNRDNHLFSGLQFAIMTPEEHWPEEKVEEIKYIIGKYLKGGEA